ncbi:MAG TPA: choice-of-anchor Q domain-containing protein [Thermoanaerobaculia bacterium]
MKSKPLHTLFTILLLLTAPLARAATITVTNTADSGPGSLRQAIADAAPNDIIAFSSSTNEGVNFHDGASHIITLTSDQLAIDKNLTIVGPGADVLAVRRADAAPSFRIFEIRNSATAVTLSGITITNGKLDSLGQNKGGGIRNEGALTIVNASVSGNRATGIIDPSDPNIRTYGNYGGGIWNSGTLVVADSKISDNAAEEGNNDNYGGGIYSTLGASLTITRSTISGNSVSGDRGYNLGGGILDQGAFSMTSCAVTGNSTTGLASPPFGGGLYKVYGGTITNSTFAGNFASSGGGAIHYAGGPGLTLLHTTISGNSSSRGGGIQCGAATYDAGTAAHCIIAGNSASATWFGGPDLDGGIRSNGYNLIGNTNASFGWISTDRQNVDANLGPLQDNGGPTLTMAPLAGSPAIDAGDPAFSIATLPTDQRGFVRSKGGTIDIGAVESNSYRNLAPTANAGPNQPARAGVPVQLNGSQSFDDNTANLSFAWSFQSKPANSSATLTNANTAAPSFTPDVPGEYVAQLIVTDNEYPPLSSAPATVTISSDNQAPTAVATANPQLPVVGQSVLLSSAGSVDPESDAIAYLWELTTRPSGSTAVISGGAQPTASFVPDKAGDYTVRLTAADFLGDGAPVSINVTASTPMGIADHLRAASAHAERLSGSGITSPGNLNAFIGFIQQALKDLQKGHNAKAMHSIDQAIERTDGFPLRGGVDQQGPSRDWILSQPAQMFLYQHLTAARASL